MVTVVQVNVRMYFYDTVLEVTTEFCTKEENMLVLRHVTKIFILRKRFENKTQMLHLYVVIQDDEMEHC